MSTKTGVAPSRAMRSGRREERVRRGDDLIPGLEVERHEGGQQGVGARGDAEGEAGAAVLGKLSLEPLDLRAP